MPDSWGETDNQHQSSQSDSFIVMTYSEYLTTLKNNLSVIHKPKAFFSSFI